MRQQLRNSHRHDIEFRLFFSPESSTRGPFGVHHPDFSPSGRTCPVGRAQTSLRQHQIRHREQHMQLRRVLRQTLVAALAMPEQVLHHMERVLDLRADARLGVLRLLDELASRVRLVQLLVG